MPLFFFHLISWNVDVMVRALAAVLNYERAVNLKESQTRSEDTNTVLDFLPPDLFYVRNK